MADPRFLTHRHELPSSPSSWHDAEWGITRASTIRSKDRRMEASTYLSDGYGRRLAIESRPTGWVRLGDTAHVWQPSRLKGIVVPQQYGVPFLAAGQVFETQPSPRKFLSLEKTPEAEARFVRHGTVLLTCSGSVGRVTFASRLHTGRVITHDLLRIEPLDSRLRGWIYAFLRTPFFRSMATSSHYGHMIKHLEPEHVNSLPILNIDERFVKEFGESFDLLLASRDQADRLVAEAFDLYAGALGADFSANGEEQTFSISARAVLDSKRLRLDASHYTPTVQAIQAAMRRATTVVERLSDVTDAVWWPGRFKRAFGPNGTPYVSADELFDLNPPITKRIYAGLVDKAQEYFVEPGWLLMARSGQIYGLNGRVLIASERHREFFVSEDIIRIIPDVERITAGYLHAVLAHPGLGRPLVLRHAYGTSIPHLEPGDLAALPIPRFPMEIETPISDRMERAAQLRSEADKIEDDMSERAVALIETFLHADL